MDETSSKHPLINFKSHTHHIVAVEALNIRDCQSDQDNELRPEFI